MNTNNADMLMNRIIEGDANSAEWAQFEAHAAESPQLWRDLAAAQRDQRLLESTMQRAAAVADTVEAPFSVDVSIDQSVTRKLFARSGWAVAAMLLIAAGVQQWRLQNSTTVDNRSIPITNPTQNASLVPIHNANDALQEYLTRGKEEGAVIREIPQRIMLDKRPLENGEGYEVVYMRQILERTTVPELYYESGETDAGVPAFSRYEPTMQQPL